MISTIAGKKLTTKSQPKSMAFVSHIYFKFAVEYSEAVIKNPYNTNNLDPRLLASICFSYFALEAMVNEYICFNNLIPENLEDMKIPLTDRVKKIIGFLAGKEPYNSLKILEKLRHALVHFYPEIEFINNYSKNGVLKRNAVELKIENDLKNKFCIPENTDIALFPFRSITTECSKWACDTVFLTTRQIEKIANKERKKGLFGIYNIENNCAFITYEVRSKYFKGKRKIVHKLCSS